MTERHCPFLNPLQRDGTNQNQRLLDALLPQNTPIDERSFADLLVYTHEYASLLRYYNETNAPAGNWKDFIANDVSTTAALISVSKFKHYKTDFDHALQVMEDGDYTENHYKELFVPLFQFIEQLGRWYQQSPKGQTLHTTLGRLRGVVEEIVAASPPSSDISRFRKLWFSAEITPGAQYPTIEATDSASDIATKLELASKPIVRNMNVLLETASFLVKHAHDYLQETLEHYPEHQPHMALLLAFLHLFKYAQDHLNTLTAKHLNFYYTDILQLQRKGEQPDQVHLVFELAKQLSEYKLAEDTFVKAGKDNSGNPLFYATDQELVVNQAVLDKTHGLKTVFIDSNETHEIIDIHHASVANSSDGLGAAIEDEEGKWASFGNQNMPPATVGFAIASPMFLLAEGERTITLQFELDSLPRALKNRIDTAPDTLLKSIRVFASSEKAWIPLTLSSLDAVDKTREKPGKGGGFGFSFERRFSDKNLPAFRERGLSLREKTRILREKSKVEKAKPQKKATPEPEAAAPYLSFKLLLETESPAITPYNDQVLQQGFATQDPVIKFEFANADTNASENPYGYFKDLKIKKLNIDIQATGIKNLVLENDLGILNPSKPFLPFGPVPKEGSKFYIGSNEILQKPLRSLTVNVSWGDLPTTDFATHYAAYTIGANPIVKDNCYFKAVMSVLYQGVWKAEGTQKKKLFNSCQTDKDKEKTAVIEANRSFYYAKALKRPDTFTPFTQFSNSLQYGFVRFDLQQSFLHSLYPRYLADSLRHVDSPPPAPNPPYTPLITAISVDYQSRETVDFSASTQKQPARLFQIMPFGYTPFSSTKRYLLGHFPVVDSDASIAEGTLYIGIKHLHPPQNLSLLFQVAEGSANPDKEAETVHWAYLTNNSWVDFKNTEILSDKTNGLLTSGIIRFAMPEKISQENTLLPSGLHWIKASVASNTDAVSQIIAVVPQAVISSFRNENNDLSHLETALPAETISKLKNRSASIKKVMQPYASFGGQVAETDLVFYRRVSERLRHKDRAISIFDYERLVLEKFPQVYKVKCINHTDKASEYVPGHVRLIVVPDLRNKNAIDPLQPRLPQNTLLEIRQYLKAHASDFAAISVTNPQYEAIKVYLNVVFQAGRDKGFYEKQLNSDIVRFLSPWLYDDASDLSFGGRIHRTWILNHVEELDYIDYITDFRMDHILNIEAGTGLENVEEARVTSSSSVLVSFREHVIASSDPSACRLKKPELSDG